MKPITHFFFALALAVILFPIFGWKSALIIAGGVLIDIDHYFPYAIRYKKFSVFDCYNYYSAQMDKKEFDINLGILLVFHTVEFLAIMAVLSIYNQLALLFTIGMTLHFVLDAIYLYSVPGRIIANHSLAWWIYRNRVKKH